MNKTDKIGLLPLRTLLYYNKRKDTFTVSMYLPGECYLVNSEHYSNPEGELGKNSRGYT